MKMEKVSYGGWDNCWRISNPVVDLVVTADVGPRIIRFGFVGDVNEFKEYPDELGLTGGDDWRLYGGHRLWHAPEDSVRTYWPDNAPVEVKSFKSYARFSQPVELTTGIQKQIEIRLDPQEARVEVTHRLTNLGLWDVELSAWALSVMDTGGVAIVPLPARGEHPRDLIPTSTIILWPYANLTDPRWTIGEQYILFRQHPRWSRPQKIGVSVPDGWAAYARQGHLFVKQFDYFAEAVYPDLGSCVELFNRQEMAELETLGPLVVLAPGQSVEHVETWRLLKNIPQPETEADVIRYVVPAIAALK
jgi:hypothetical protein